MSTITAGPLPQHDETYFGHLRRDVLREIPAATSRVLSIGCGAGATEAELVHRGMRVVGIELDPVAAARARSRGVEVLTGDVHEVAEQLRGRRFDCLLYADVLEHVADPEALLREHLRLLEPGGAVVVSVPNFRYLEVLWALAVRGEIRYRDAGILDRTHLRLTTRRMVARWLRDAGLERIRWTYQVARRRDRLADALSFHLATDLLAQQAIVLGIRPTEGEAG